LICPIVGNVFLEICWSIILLRGLDDNDANAKIIGVNFFDSIGQLIDGGFLLLL
jgi:hypothetical protein